MPQWKNVKIKKEINNFLIATVSCKRNPWREIISRYIFPMSFVKQKEIMFSFFSHVKILCNIKNQVLRISVNISYEFHFEQKWPIFCSFIYTVKHGFLKFTGEFLYVRRSCVQQIIFQHSDPGFAFSGIFWSALTTYRGFTLSWLLLQFQALQGCPICCIFPTFRISKRVQKTETSEKLHLSFQLILCKNLSPNRSAYWISNSWC